MAEIVPGGEQYEGVDDATRQGGLDKLKAKMGGDVPWYKKDSASTPREVRVDKALDMADTLITDRKVPRRPPLGTPGQSETN